MATGLQRIGAPPHVVSLLQTDAYTYGGRASEHRLWLERWADHIERLLGKGNGAKLLGFPQTRDA
jgi:hypothetical protein